MKPVKGFEKITGLRITHTKWVWEIRLPSDQPNGGNALWLMGANPKQRELNSIRVTIDWDTETVSSTIHRRGAGTAGTTSITTTIGPKECASPARFAEAIAFTLERMKDTDLWQKYITPTN